MPPEPTCRYCQRRYSDPRGCEYLPEDPGPLAYGDEQHPLSSTPTCRDCGTPCGSLHHVECLIAECPACHGQWHPGESCEAWALLTTGGAA